MENNSIFSISEAIKFGWSTFKENFAFLTTVSVIYLFFSALLKIAVEQAIEMDFVTSLIFDVAIYAISMIMIIGLMKIALKLYDNQKTEFFDLFCHYRLFFKYFAGTILYSLIVAVGLILFIVPGIIWALKFYFFDYYIVDKNCNPIEALKKSSEATMGHKWQLFLFVFLLSIINLAGMLFFIVGLIVTIPLTLIATAFVYRKLSVQTKTIEEMKV